MKFSPKIGNREELEYQERIFNLIVYCFGNNNYNDNFICINKKIKILSQLEKKYIIKKITIKQITII